MGAKGLCYLAPFRSEENGDVGNPVLAQVSQYVWTRPTRRTALKTPCTAPGAPLPLRDPHLAAQTPLFISLQD